MSFTAVIDISTFIWSKEDYNSNKNYFFELLIIVPTVFEQIKKLKLPILLRNELFETIATEFPFADIDDMGFSYYSAQTLRFLIDNKWSIYEESKENDLTTIPDIIKNHFNQKIKEESNHLVVHLFNHALEHKFIAYKHFYNTQTNLSIENKLNEKSEIDTLYYNSDKEVINFFEKYQIKFQHNPKHDMYKSGGEISFLSCYNEREGNTSKAQELLDKAFFHEGHYYNFDMENNVFVRFIKTSELIYHGHDLSDEGNNIPNSVKKKYSK
ncbi:MAG: hypothetical protein H0V01_13955 [Bacteroidetes bacterium]|nr:hypothetical protein [Bacteroidota bacterium]HET6245374.1 hypothetical protein [Bacteroidia bacterium]